MAETIAMNLEMRAFFARGKLICLQFLELYEVFDVSSLIKSAFIYFYFHIFRSLVDSPGDNPYL